MTLKETLHSIVHSFRDYIRMPTASEMATGALSAQMVLAPMAAGQTKEIGNIRVKHSDVIYDKNGAPIDRNKIKGSYVINTYDDKSSEGDVILGTNAAKDTVYVQRNIHGGLKTTTFLPGNQKVYSVHPFTFDELLKVDARDESEVPCFPSGWNAQADNWKSKWRLETDDGKDGKTMPKSGSSTKESKPRDYAIAEGDKSISGHVLATDPYITIGVGDATTAFDFGSAIPLTFKTHPMKPFMKTLDKVIDALGNESDKRSYDQLKHSNYAMAIRGDERILELTENYLNNDFKIDPKEAAELADLVAQSGRTELLVGVTAYHDKGYVLLNGKEVEVDGEWVPLVLAINAHRKSADEHLKLDIHVYRGNLPGGTTNGGNSGKLPAPKPTGQNPAQGTTNNIPGSTNTELPESTIDKCYNEDGHSRTNLYAGLGAQWDQDHDKLIPEASVGIDFGSFDFALRFGYMLPDEHRGDDSVWVAPAGGGIALNNHLNEHMYAGARLMVGGRFKFGINGQFNWDQKTIINYFGKEWANDRNGNPRYTYGTLPDKFYNNSYFSGGASAQQHLGKGWRISEDVVVSEKYKPAMGLTLSKDL